MDKTFQFMLACMYAMPSINWCIVYIANYQYLAERLPGWFIILLIISHGVIGINIWVKAMKHFKHERVRRVHEEQLWRMMEELGDIPACNLKKSGDEASGIEEETT